MGATLSFIILLFTSGEAAAQESVSREEFDRLKQQIEQIEQGRDELRRANSVVHLSGYAAVGYTDSDAENGRFSEVLFAPVLHYLYGDLFLLESELEFEVAEDGETETNLEYMAIDLFINDYTILVAGKFLSPLGQFRQNIHPSWINKLPSAPPGFGHDEAAPLADVGLQLRGGLRPVKERVRVTYALYVANGPTLVREDEDGEVTIHIDSRGGTSDEDGNKTWGGRLGGVLAGGFELGVSGAMGKTGVENADTEPKRDYNAAGFDFAFVQRQWETRGEYIRQEIDSDTTSAFPASHEWVSWYVQGSYKFLPAKWETVVRYTDFDAPEQRHDQEQWALGVNYLFAPNAIAKLAYESNDGIADTPADDDRVMVQLAYGF